jgi:hypothetical protein
MSAIIENTQDYIVIYIYNTIRKPANNFDL